MPPAAPRSSPFVFIHGDDDYAVRQRARQLYDQWCAEIGGMDHEIIDASATNSDTALKAMYRLREALNTLPFFGGGKAIWFQGCNFLGDDRTGGSAIVTEALTELGHDLKTFAWQNVRLLISAGKADKRKTIYKTAEKSGTIEYFKAWSLEDKQWIAEAEALVLRALRARKKSIGDYALAELINTTGPNSQQLINEAEKLSLYVGPRETIEAADVAAIVTRQKQAKAFALADALGDRDLPRVLRTLDRELWEMQFDKQKSEIGLLYGLISKVRLLILLKEMTREGWLKPEVDYYRFKPQLERVPPGQLPEDKKFNPLAMHPFMVHKALLQSQKYQREELVRAMGLLLECNQRLVSSSLDESLVLQQALVQIVRPAL